MKTNFLLLALLLVTTSLFAQTDQNINLEDPSSLVAYLTPIIVLVTTKLVRLVKPSIPGWATMVVVMLLSLIVTWLTNYIGDPDVNYLQQFLLGLVSVFIHQFKEQVK